MEVAWGQPCALLPWARALTCSTLELGEDGLGLAVPLPTLLQGKVVHVSDRRPTAPLTPSPDPSPARRG